MTAALGVNVHGAVRSAMATTKSVDPGSIASEVARSLNTEQRNVLLVRLLTDHVRSQFGVWLRGNRAFPDERVLATLTDIELQVAETLKRSDPAVGVLLTQRVSIGNGKYKFLAQLDKADLMRGARRLRSQAHGCLDSAEKRERLAGLLGEGQFVVDLTDEQITKGWWKK